MEKLIALISKFTGGNKISPEVVSSVEEVAKKVSEGMIDSRDNLPYPLLIMQDCDFHRFTQDRGIQDYLLHLAQICLEGYTPDKKLLDFIKKTKKHYYLDKAVENLIHQAFMDTYILQIIGIHYGIGKQQLKSLLFSNMLYGNREPGSSITSLFVELIDTTGKMKISIEDLQKKLKNNKGNGNMRNPACPLHNSDYRTEFIDELWKYIESHIIPLMQDTFKSSSFAWEQYWSGNNIKDPTN